jgi:hypothetical protein
MPNTSIQFLKRFCPSPVIIFSWFFCNIKAVSIFFDPPFVASLNRKAVILLFMLIFNYTHFELWKNEHLNLCKAQAKIDCFLGFSNIFLYGAGNTYKQCRSNFIYGIFYNWNIFTRRFKKLKARRVIPIC